MSGLLAGKVWQSALSPHLKPLAAALADIGNDDGTSIYPSVSYVSWLLGRSERAVQYGLDELRSMGVLVIEKNGRGGRHSTTEYRMVEAKLPVRQPWREVRKGATVSPIAVENSATPAPLHNQNSATVAPIAEQKGATDDTKGCNPRHERVKLVAPEPSLTVFEPKEGAQAQTRPSPPLAFRGAHLRLTEKQDRLLGEAFPWIDRQSEYRKMDSWLEAHPERRIKKFSAFAHNWCQRNSPKGGHSNGNAKPSANDAAASFVQHFTEPKQERAN